MTNATRVLLLATLSPLALASPAMAQPSPQAQQAAEAQAQAQDNAVGTAEVINEKTIIVTGTRTAEPHGRQQPRPSRRHRRRGHRKLWPDRDQPDPQPAGPVLQFPAAVDRRRFRCASPGDAARPCTRPDLGADQRQAAACRRAAQHQRDGRTRQRRRRPQPHSRNCDQPSRGAARRRRGPIWLGRDRRRHQYPAEERQSWRPGGGDLGRIYYDRQRCRQCHRAADQFGGPADPRSDRLALLPRQQRWRSPRPGRRAIDHRRQHRPAARPQRVRQPQRRISSPRGRQSRRLRPAAQLHLGRNIGDDRIRLA